jgi:site-specific DNA-methyltransferase (adenine-specific)
MQHRSHEDRIVTPYYSDSLVTIYHGDCREVLPTLRQPWGALISDPPYPNNAGHFLDGIAAAKVIVADSKWSDALVFWSEIDRPVTRLPLVAVHVWHRTNVSGRPYEAIYHLATDGRKRRSRVFKHAVEFENATGAEYLGHPTQKPVALMTALVALTTGPVCDPFCGVGSTLRAAKNMGRRAIGIEIEERYCEIAAERCRQEVLDFGGAA